MFGSYQSQKRSHESPMDYEWDKTQGPTDPLSPFPLSQGPKTGFGSAKPFQSFENLSSSFAEAATANPATPFRNPSFTTPRKPFEPELFSEVSGAETSPGGNTDFNDTPDPPKPEQTMTAFKGDTVRKPLFQKYGAGYLGSSPGRADRRGGKYGNAILQQKVRKRKRLERDYALVRGLRNDSDSESDSGESRPQSRKGRKSKQEQQPGYFASIFNYIESHPNLPNVLSYYAQLAVNGFIAALTIFGVWTFWMTVRADVDKASEGERGLVLAEIAKCARDYVDNRCGASSRLPALEIVCDNWEHCMHRDPNSIGRARVSAHTFAQIFNSFIEPISYKAMIFVVLIVTVCILVNNLAFGMFRAKAPHPSQAFFPPTPHPSNYAWGPQPPQTPQHNNMGYDAFGQQNYAAIMPSHTPHGSPSKGDKGRSPSKGNRSPSKGDREMLHY